MEKNKIRFIIWLLIVIIILLATAVGVLLVKSINKDDTKVTEGANTITNVQQKEEVNSGIVENKKELTEARVLELAKKVLENSRGSSDSVVKVMYGSVIGKNGKQYTDTTTGSLYNLTDLGYNKFKAQALQNMSEKYFEELNNFKGRKIVIDKDGYLGILEGTWSGVVHEVKNVKLDKSENDIYYYTVNTTQKQGEISKEVMYNLCVKLENDNFVIDSLDIINELNSEVVENKKELTEARVLELAKMVLENSRGSSDSVVKVMYGSVIGKNGKQYTDTTTNSLYNLTDLGYNKFKAQALQNMSEKYFEELNDFKGRKIVIDKNGYLGILEGTWSGVVYEVKNVKLEKSENDTYYYTVNATDNQGEVSKDVMYTLCIKLENDNFVIDSLVIKYVN